MLITLTRFTQDADGSAYAAISERLADRAHDLAGQLDDLMDAETPIWIHLERDPTDKSDAWNQLRQSEIWASLQEALPLHPLACQDAMRERHPPKYERFPDHSFLIFRYFAETDGHEFELAPLNLFVGHRFLVTLAPKGAGFVGRLQSKLCRENSIENPPLSRAACQMMRKVMDEYISYLHEIEPRLDELEDSLMSSDEVDEHLSELTAYKSTLKRLRRIFSYQNESLTEVSAELNSEDEPSFFPEELQHELHDVYEQQERASSLTLLYYELASDLMEGFLSMASHRLNQIMKVLTMVTSIFVPLGFLAGLYGMNFEWIPELGFRFGYFLLLGVMGVISVGLLIAFRKKRWL